MSRRIAFALACLIAPVLARAQATNPAADPSTSQTPEAARRARPMVITARSTG